MRCLAASALATLLLYSHGLLCVAEKEHALRLTLRHFEEHEHVRKHGERGALYGFMLENIDHETGEVHGSNVTNVKVEGRFPAGAVIDEKYYYLEANDGALERGETHSNEDAVKECAVRHEPSQPVVVTCDIPFVLAQVGMYVHANYPEGAFTDAELEAMERERHQFVGQVYHKGSVVAEDHADLFHHWENPKDEV